MPWGEEGWKKVAKEARSRGYDFSTFITVQEAARILGTTVGAVANRYEWLEGTKIGGRRLVKRDRTEWLQKFRAGTLPESDRMGELLARYDVAARKREIAEAKEASERAKEAARPKGLVVDAYGRFWVDHDANDTWIPTRYAVINLGIMRHNVRRLANRGRIARRWADAKTWQPVDAPPGNKGNCQIRAMYSLRDIENYMARRERRGRWRNAFNLNDPDRPQVYIRLYPMERAAHERKLISREEAAAILQVSAGRVSALISNGKLKAYTKDPYKHGRVWFSEDQVREYALGLDRVLRRHRYFEYVRAREAGKWHRKSPEPWSHTFGVPELYVLNKSLHKDHGEYYTLRQAAHVLYCSVSNVRSIVKRGVLEGFKLPCKRPTDKWKSHRWWFVRKEDVHAYKAGRFRRRKRAAWENSHAPVYREEVRGSV